MYHNIFDTHSHYDDSKFDPDREELLNNLQSQGVSLVVSCGCDIDSTQFNFDLAQKYDYMYFAAGFHPENLKGATLDDLKVIERFAKNDKCVAIGEIGLDYYWSREFENEQLEAFEEQVKWSVETQLPLMIHCRKAQNEMVHLLRKYEKELPGGVFHCFTGNQKEAEELLSFDKFVLGVGGVSTFKSSHLREDLPAVVPLDRIVLETDSPYMAPVPYRGKRNESAFVVEVMKTLAKAYGISEEEFARQTNLNAERVFPLSVSQV